ncbi:putative entry exclusion protein TrbK-alt [Methylosinus sp. Sm6]|uniref:putative entry exclusion protein TrbK-alt n=1 Tax=Methylosinus sp. Sm6 TaxID=2866948 RepID=UPI001C98FEC5|nr:putative entry exclusion protein TrbK-alt [Methylosinus sp. Sm6]MBY6243682.1 putative entry exclusion protein TrbK-alt [Methylosinus sp. Sm6]
MGQWDIWRAGAILVLIATLIVTLSAIDRDKPTPFVRDAGAPIAIDLDDLSAELRRCGALALEDAEDQRCEAVWTENRRRFFGRPARPTPPTAAPAAATSKGAAP